MKQMRFKKNGYFLYILLWVTLKKLENTVKGSDWLSKVVELSMQCCGKLLSDSFETY